MYPDRYSLEGMQIGIEGSLKRLGVETIALLQLHCIPMEILQQGDIFHWLQLMREQGKNPRVRRERGDRGRGLALLGTTWPDVATSHLQRFPPKASPRTL